MTDKLKKINIMEACILLMPIIDVINTITGLSVSLLIRGLFLIGIFIYFIFANKSKYKKISFLLFSILGIFASIYIFHYFMLNGTYNIINELITLIKFLYLPAITICLVNYYDNKEFNLTKIITKISWIYCILIIVPTILNISLASYSDGKLGTSGLFYSPNELSAILAILSPFVVFSLFKEERKISNIILNVLFIISCYLIGTKTPIMGLLLSLAAGLLINIINMFIYKKNYLNVIISILFLTSSIFCYQFSYLHSNLNYQSTNYVDKTPNSDSTEDNPSIESELHNNDIYINFPTHVYEKEISDNKLLNLIFSSRNIYLQENLNKYSNTILSKQIFGLTLGPSNNNPNASNMSEMDMLDIFIYYGIIGAIILLGYLILILILAIIKYFKNFKKNIKDNDLNASMVSFALALLIAFTAGHTLSAPAVSLYIALSVCYILKKLEIFKKTPKKILIKPFLAIVFVYIILAIILIFNNQKEEIIIELSLENNILSSNTEIIKVEEQNIEFEGIADNLKYYTIASYKNIQIIYVTRTFENQNKIEFITLNNNENVTINFDLTILNDFNDYERKSNYLYAIKDDYKLISNTYHYVTNSKDIESFNKYTYKNLTNESTDYLTEDDKVIKKIKLNANESADTYIISLNKEVNDIENIPWISFNGYYVNLYNNIYIRSYNIPVSLSSQLKDLLTNNYLMNMFNYSNYDQGIWYKDYYIIPYTSFEKNNLFINATTNYIINKNLESTNNSLYNNFASLVKEYYYKRQYLRTENGIIFNTLTDSSFIEQINIINILLRDYLINNDSTSRNIAINILNELENDNWLNDQNIYEYITSGLKYIGNISDPLIIFSLIELSNNLDECHINNDKIKTYINISYQVLKDKLSDEQLIYLEEGGYIE